MRVKAISVNADGTKPALDRTGLDLATGIVCFTERVAEALEANEWRLVRLEANDGLQTQSLTVSSGPSEALIDFVVQCHIRCGVVSQAEPLKLVITTFSSTSTSDTVEHTLDNLAAMPAHLAFFIREAVEHGVVRQININNGPYKLGQVVIGKKLPSVAQTPVQSNLVIEIDRSKLVLVNIGADVGQVELSKQQPEALKYWADLLHLDTDTLLKLSKEQQLRVVSAQATENHEQIKETVSTFTPLPRKEWNACDSEWLQ